MLDSLTRPFKLTALPAFCQNYSALFTFELDNAQ